MVKPITLYCDNMSSIQLANNPVFHTRTKHIEVHYHYLQEKVLAHEIDLVYVSTHEQLADIFTKLFWEQRRCKGFELCLEYKTLG